MNRTLHYHILFMIICLTGCSQIKIPFISEKSAAEPPVGGVKAPNTLESNEFIAKGKIVNAQKLKGQNKIAFMPFKAGTGAVASDELDRTAMTIIQSVSEAFDNDQGGKHDHFEVLTADQAESAELIVKGYITDMAEPSKFKKWILLKNKRVLSVEGKIFDVNSGETVVLFEDHAIASSKSEDYASLGAQIGKNIGRYILSGIR